MDFIRWLKVDKFDTRKNRFTSVAFRKSGNDGALSLVEEFCAVSSSGGIPEHGRRFYASQVNDPVIWWPFNESELPVGHIATQTDSDTGDRCHYNITNVEDGDLRRMILSKTVNQFMIETKDGARPLARDDLPA